VLLGQGTPAWAQGNTRQPQLNAKETETVILIPAPGLPEWGKHIPGSSGQIELCREAEGALVATIKLSGLEKDKAYKLGLNGKEGCDGNEQLMRFGRWGFEGVYDFQTVATDKSGSVRAAMNVRLPVSRYDVKFFVKDITDKYTIVLYQNDLRFDVE